MEVLKMQIIDYIVLGSITLAAFVATNALIGGEIQTLLTREATA
jgi:hypothetical protein